MTSYSLGYIKPSAAGTVLPMSTVLAALGLPANLSAHSMHVWPLQANTKAVYVGLATPAQGGANPQTAAMVRSTGVSILKQIAAPSTYGKNDDWKVCAAHGTNTVLVANYAFDVDNTGDGLSGELVVL